MKRWLTRIGIALGALLALLLAYGVLVEPRLILDEDRETVPMPRLGADLAGTEVAVISDFQLGMWFANTGMVERIVDRVVELDPAVALVVGDFVYSHDPALPEQVRSVVDLLEPLVGAGIPTYAVLGNHDHAIGAADELTRALEELGIPVLVNTAVTVPPPDAGRTPGDGSPPLYVVGVGSHTADRSAPADALDAVPADAARVVMMHHPLSFPAVPAGAAQLAVAGHTHCGQVALPGMPAWSYVQLTEDERVAVDGFAPDSFGQPGNRLFVTCGIGFSLAPVRIGVPPQLAVFELSAGPA